jgi:small-conductance mechanosensitive channel
VLQLPGPPEAIVVRFAQSGIDLELGFWIGDPENGQGALKSAILRRVWRAYRDAGIEIAFPQRDVRVIGAKTGDRLAVPGASGPPVGPEPGR